MSYQHITLKNGLRVIHQSTSSNVAYCGFAVNVGTRDEQENELGMAHFIEHLIFKGTKHRKAWHILNRMENVGGDLNAYTNKEETVVYSAFLAEHFERAVELLSDIVFSPTFPQHEIEKEVEVILDEISSYEDSPSELIYDDVENLLFAGHELGRNVLGDPTQLKGFTTADALRFTQQFYQPSNMVFFVRGKMDFKQVVRCCERYTLEIAPTTFLPTRKAPIAYVPQEIRRVKETHQSHVMLANRAYSVADEQRTGLYLLNNILGGPGMNSRLNLALRERRGLVYEVESSLSAYTDAGAFTIYFGTDKKDAAHCIDLVHKELKELREKRLTTARLSAAKKQLIGQIGVSSDNFENDTLDMAKVFLHYNKFIIREEMYKRIDDLTIEELFAIANEIFDPQQLTTLIYE
ncbi:MAG: pitrilysin family protein [Bacteroidaceae bacterium]